MVVKSVRRAFAIILGIMLAITLLATWADRAWGQTCGTGPWQYAIVGDVTEDASRQFRSFLEEARKGGAKEVTIRISSRGGMANSALDMIRAMKASELQLTCIGSRLVASAAAMILVTCDRRLAEPNTTILFHRLFRVEEGGRLTPEVAEARAREMNMLASLLDAFVYSRIGLTKAQYLEKVGNGKDWILLPDQALAAKVIHGIVP